MKELRPILASEYVTFNAVAKAGLVQFGGVPVNDVFMPMWEREAKIWVLYGGRGGGKSEAVVDRLIAESRKPGYFKCYYGRKVFDTVRGSCFATIVASIKKLGLEREFRFSEADSSSMMITHIATGHKFIPFGSDKADKLKSIKDPTHIWCEEFPEFTFEDFKELYPTLRTERGHNVFIATLNAYSIFTDNWIVKTFFATEYTGNDKSVTDILDGVSVERIFANYPDNHFINHETYKQTLWIASAGNLIIFEGLANGSWGVVENTNPWLYSFDYEKHVKPAAFLPSYPVYIFIDVNNDPLECTLWQMSPNKGGRNSFLHCIDEFSGKYKVQQLCEIIRSKYPASILYLGGDRSGQNEDVGRNQTIYQIMGSLLGLSAKQLLLNTYNLEHADSRLLCNSMFANYPNLRIDPSCTNYIRQCQLATVDEKSAKPSQLLKDRGMYKMDCFDSGRYMFQTMFNEFVRETYLRVMNKR